jgi:hypothetical protein
MGTVARFKSCRVVIYTKDHRPAHVHVIGPGAKAVFLLDDSLTLKRSKGFSESAIKNLREFLSESKSELKEAWYEIHEKY